MLEKSTAIARVLGTLPEIVEHEFGKKALHSALSRSGLPIQLLENRDLYIPKSSIVSFFHNVSREAGEEKLGLMFAPLHTVSAYGIWGDYVLSAPTLLSCLKRTKKALRYHSSGDKVSLSVHGDLFRYEYFLNTRPIAGYNQIIPCSAGSAANIFKHYLGDSWVPECIELNIPKPRINSIYEETFRCPVVFGAASMAIVARREVLDTPNPLKITSRIPTIRDVHDACNGGSPKNLQETIYETIKTQLLNNQVSIENAANILSIGVRKLQRELENEGYNFRSLVNKVRADRAKELLLERDISITDISEILGYSVPTHFARAFQKHCGMSPSEFRSVS
jgi:AraC-like DNA-binding protein